MTKKILLASCIGSMLEMFDFYIYATFLNVMASTFFPTENKILSLFISVGGWGIALIAHPIGALIFGYFGDIFGRKNTFAFTLIFMSFPTIIIGILPSYNEIGIIAPIIVITGRLIQGICYGGELNGAFIFALEHMPQKQGLASGLIISSCVCGILSATALSYITQLPGMPSWAWRISFCLGGSVGFIGYFIRKKLIESDEFLRTFSKTKIPLFTIIHKRKTACFLCFSIGALIGGFFYIDFCFLSVYLSRYCHLPSETIWKLNIYLILSIMSVGPLFGALYDHLKSPLFLRVMCYGLFFGTIPVFWLLLSHLAFLFILGGILLGICTASISTVGFVIMQNLFPVKERYSGISLFYCLGISIYGGISPLFYIEAIEIHNESLFFPAYCLMCLISLFYAALKINNVTEQNAPIRNDQVFFEDIKKAG
ncbi:MAG: MFS transporter [Proteobacteria bacterium]|nr:MFS transporter [Pseudomonadota bacterium]